MDTPDVVNFKSEILPSLWKDDFNLLKESKYKVIPALPCFGDAPTMLVSGLFLTHYLTTFASSHSIYGTPVVIIRPEDFDQFKAEAKTFNDNPYRFQVESIGPCNALATVKIRIYTVSMLDYVRLRNEDLPSFFKSKFNAINKVCIERTAKFFVKNKMSDPGLDEEILEVTKRFVRKMTSLGEQEYESRFGISRTLLRSLVQSDPLYPKFEKGVNEISVIPISAIRAHHLDSFCDNLSLDKVHSYLGDSAALLLDKIHYGSPSS